MFVKKTLEIDAYHGNTGDKSTHAGHYYSDKAPGIVVLAVPAFALSAGILHVLDIDIDSPRGWFISDWITTALSVGLISAAGGAALFLLLSKLGPRSSALLTTLAIYLGSVPFPYSTMLFSHAAVVGLLCVALWAIADQGFLNRHVCLDWRKDQRLKPNVEESPTSSPGSSPTARYILAGFCCGFAIASEFPAAIAAAGVLILATLTGIRRGLLLAVAAIPPVLLLPAYNWACFGNPLSFGYHHLASPDFQEMNKGLFGITFPPKASAAYVILLSAKRGLFFWTPFFLVAFLGLKPLWNASRAVFWVAAGVIAIQVIAMSGYYMPHGGGALGPRHLAPMLPFLAIITVHGVTKCVAAGGVLGYLSIVLTGAATLVHAMPSEKLQIFLPTFYLHCFFGGVFAPNLGQVLGLSSHFSILPMIAALAVASFWTYCLAVPRTVVQQKPSAKE